jgi:plasmid stability protein
MAAMTIRNIDEALKSRLRIRAAVHGRSMEEEARDILRAALSIETLAVGGLGQTIRARFERLGGTDLADIPREAIRDAIDFGS